MIRMLIIHHKQTQNNLDILWFSYVIVHVLVPTNISIESSKMHIVLKKYLI
jgi:hypothetical protein